MSKVYLGDGVYVAVENGMAKLTAEDGIRATNTIWLEPEVASELFNWLKSILKLGEAEAQSAGGATQ
jgi:hypothetical protein